MFEQRVLSAYREKVAKERQAKLLEEIEAEHQQDAQRKAKKAKDALRRKDKAAKKKEAQAEEKARKEAEKAAEEEARRAEEARKVEEQRVKAEEKRKKKEAQRKAEEEERQRKEAERLRKTQEREEAERKAREAREREKKARDEARLKEKETRERKEREAREKREQQERERREKEAKAKADREAREHKEGKDAKDKRKREERAAHKAAALAAAVPVPVAAPKRPAAQQPPPTPVAAVPVLPQPTPTSYASPKIPVATPAFPKAPTPMRARQPSQQESSAASSGSVASQNPSPHALTPVHASPGPIAPPSKSGAPASSSQSNAQPSPHSASPMGLPIKSIPPQHSPFGMPPMGAAMSFPPGLPQIPPGFGNAIHRDPLFPPIAGFRPAPGMLPMPPGFGGPVGNRGFPMHPPPGFHGPMESPVPSLAQLMGPGLQKENTSPHSRQGSGSFDAGASQPISRPTPIGRPASVVQGQRPSSGSPSSGLPRPEPDAHLGSRALLDDLDDGLQDFPGRLSRGGSAPGPRPVPGFPMGPFGMDPIFPSHSNLWGPPGALQPNPFGPLPPPGFGHNPLNVHHSPMMPWGHPMPPASTFGGQGVIDRPIEPRSVAVRKMLRRACEELTDAENKKAEDPASDAFIPLERIKTQVGMFNHGYPVDERELLDICETEGNEINGGGSFDVRDGDQGGKLIRFVSGTERPTPQPVHRAVGYHPGSPVGGSGNGVIVGGEGGLVGGSR